MRQYITGGNHTHHYHLTQQELNLETKETVTFRTYPKLIAHIEARAQAAGVSRSKFIESSLIKFFKSETAIKKFYADLDNIVTENFL